jgi:hypothetical protein
MTRIATLDRGESLFSDHGDPAMVGRLGNRRSTRRLAPTSAVWRHSYAAQSSALGPRDTLAAIASSIGSSESLDLYALAGERSHRVMRRFRDRWLTGFEESADEYEFPQYAVRPDAVYGSPWQLIDRLLAEPTQPHSLYWRNPRPGHVLHAMLFFTTDGGLIAGLTVTTEDPGLTATTLRRLAKSVDARYGYSAWEQPPPDSASEFEAKARRAEDPRLLP